jgi:hypothetical protein
MRVDWEKAGETRKWSIETTGAVDRALAGLVTVATLVVAQLTGLSGALLHLATRLF